MLQKGVGGHGVDKAELARSADAPEIPDKLYFRIGEVSQLVGVKPYVLRYWENEFPSLAPKKSGTGHRLYRRKEVETLLEIKRLLYDKRYTIEGARTQLSLAGRKERRTASSARTPSLAKAEQRDLFGSPPSADALQKIRTGLREILQLLGG
jgi:DNA-binding transcriptional MerR regulator